LLGTRRFGRAK